MRECPSNALFVGWPLACTCKIPQNSSCTSDLMHTHNGQETVGHCLHEGIVVGQHGKKTVPRSDPNHLLNNLPYVTTNMTWDSPGTSSSCCL